jgi:hypothetical protein
LPILAAKGEIAKVVDELPVAWGERATASAERTAEVSDGSAKGVAVVELASALGDAGAEAIGFRRTLANGAGGSSAWRAVPARQAATVKRPSRRTILLAGLVTA